MGWHRPGCPRRSHHKGTVRGTADSCPRTRVVCGHSVSIEIKQLIPGSGTHVTTLSLQRGLGPGRPDSVLSPHHPGRMPRSTDVTVMLKLRRPLGSAEEERGPVCSTFFILREFFRLTKKGTLEDPPGGSPSVRPAG